MPERFKVESHEKRSKVPIFAPTMRSDMPGAKHAPASTAHRPFVVGVVLQRRRPSDRGVKPHCWLASGCRHKRQPVVED